MFADWIVWTTHVDADRKVVFPDEIHQNQVSDWMHIAQIATVAA